ncbi:MAG: Nicotinate dehydrogenase small FeS subunit [Chloroflexi bacterium ADurb.Bin180]|nr:MAG: Nicotinate dehydrogenase small FeS subunit [Chloroflexi bacterium ADurb.Bin180]
MDKNLILRMTVNGQVVEVPVSATDTLATVLRENLGLTGTKIGCEEGECGACTVLVDGLAVNSCLYLAMKAHGKTIRTVEGLARNGQLHPLQQAFIDHGAVQCGYCTPGMLLSAVALLEQNPHPTDDEIRRAISGNLCRCTGYIKIIDAIRAVAEGH